MSTLLDTIRSRGHWTVVFRPSSYDSGLVRDLGSLERAVASARVELRGWDYPHYNPNEVTRLATSIEGAVDWGTHLEAWRLYQSGQFAHVFAMREDWLERSPATSEHGIKSGTLIGSIMTLYSFTELFMFCARLSTLLPYGNRVQLEVRLSRIGGRMLHSFDPRSVGFLEHMRSDARMPDYSRVLELDSADLVARPAEMALDETCELFTRFHWDSARSVLQESQRQFLRGAS